MVAGNLNYKFNDMVELGAGITALPGTRTLRGTFPYWNKVDNRPIADEFFRQSYTSGVWAGGERSDALNYRVMDFPRRIQTVLESKQLKEKRRSHLLWRVSWLEVLEKDLGNL